MSWFNCCFTSKQHFFSFLVKSSLLILETSRTVILSQGECFLPKVIRSLGICLVKSSFLSLLHQSIKQNIWHVCFNLCNILVQCSVASKVIFLKKWANSFSFIIGLFKKTIQFLQQMNVKKCPSNIWRWDSNPQPFEHESSPMTTRPALPPSKVILCVTFVACAASWAKVTALVCSTEQGGRKDEGREIDKPFVSHSLPSISPYTVSLSLSLSLSLWRGLKLCIIQAIQFQTMCA